MRLEFHLWRIVVGIGFPSKDVTGWRWTADNDEQHYRGLSYAVWPFYVFLGWTHGGA